MAKERMLLKNGTEIELEVGASIADLQVLAVDQNAMLDIWKLFTEDNLSEVQIVIEDGLTIGRYTDLVLVSETSKIKEDGSVLTSYHFREKDSTEKRLDILEAEQEIQNGAIEELATMAAGGDI